MKILVLFFMLLLIGNTAFSLEQTLCPVMKGNKIDKNIYTEYKGKKIYFCCKLCKSIFAKDPKKYIKDLPQFQNENIKNKVNKISEEHNKESFDIHEVAEILGVATITSLFLTFFAGIFMKKNRKVIFPWHKRFAYMTITFALLHFIILQLA